MGRHTLRYSFEQALKKIVLWDHALSFVSDEGHRLSWDYNSDRPVVYLGNNQTPNTLASEHFEMWWVEADTFSFIEAVETKLEIRWVGGRYSHMPRLGEFHLAQDYLALLNMSFSDEEVVDILCNGAFEVENE